LLSTTAQRRVRAGLWVLVPALAVAPALVLSPAWGLAYGGAVLIGLPAALLLPDARPWLALAFAVSAFNVSKVMAGEVRPGVFDPTVLELKAIDLPILVLLVMAVARVVAPGGPPRVFPIPARGPLAAGALFCCWILLGAIGADRPVGVMVQSLEYVRLVLAMGAVAACVDRPELARWALAGLLLDLFAQGALAVAQFATGSSFGLYAHFQEESAVGLITRSGGTLNPTVLSEYLGLLAPVALAAAVAARRRWASAGLFALYGLAAVGVALTLSRGGLLNLAFSTALVVWAVLRAPDVEERRKTLLGGATLAFAVVLAAYFSTQALARMAQTSAEFQGDEGRITQYLQAVSMVADNPAFGVGLGNYVASMGRYGAQLPYPVHNKFLGVAAETGLPGLLLYLGLWGLVLRQLVRQARRGGGPERIFFVGAAAAVAGTLLNMNTDVFSAGGAPELALFLLAGLGLGLAGQRMDA